MPSRVLDHLVTVNLGVNCGGENVGDEEEEEDDSGPALERIHPILGPLVFGGEVVGLAPVHDKQPVDRMKENWKTEDPDFKNQKEMRRDRCEEVDDRIKLFRSGQAKRVQR